MCIIEQLNMLISLDNEDEGEDVDLEAFQRRNFFNDDEDDDWH